MLRDCLRQVNEVSGRALITSIQALKMTARRAVATSPGVNRESIRRVAEHDTRAAYAPQINHQRE